MACMLADLAQIIAGVVQTGDPLTPITGVTANSDEVRSGMMFVAVRGTSGDGHRFVEAALAAGASAVVVERDFAGDLPAAATVVRCDGTRPVPALLAQAVHGYPDQKMWTAAVTGTNGKTTTAFLIQEMLARLHGPCGLLGTIHYDDGQTVTEAPLTTPGGPDFYRHLGRMVEHGCASVAMELSSHALDQQRTAGLGLDVAVMTNLGRDHLDYHADLEAYLAAKARIMTLLRSGGERDEGRDGGGVVGTGLPGTLVINAGDVALRCLDTGDHRVISFGLAPADLQLAALELSPAGTRLELAWLGRPLLLQSPLVGRFNVENLMAALAAGIGLGLPAESCAEALSGVAQVPGRLERLGLPNGAVAVVDYAHTADALQAVIATCRELATGRLLLVFGCGGDRDQGKRPLMGEAARAADAVWITSDNPRHEEPASICEQVRRGYETASGPAASPCAVIVDRRQAVWAALAAAQTGDVVIIAGKGHEDYQLVGDQILSLDDRELVREWIAAQPQTGAGDA